MKMLNYFSFSALHLLYIFLAGALGSLVRFLVIEFVKLHYAKSKIQLPFPHHTVTVNLLACFLFPLLAILFQHASSSPSYTIFQTLILLGFLSAFSTFSSYIGDAFEHFMEGKFSNAIFYLLGTLISCLGAGMIARLILGGL